MKLAQTIIFVAGLGLMPFLGAATSTDEGGLRGLKNDKDKKNPFKGLKSNSKMEVNGGKVKKVKAKDSGEPISKMKGLQKMTESQLSNLEELPETGLFLLDTDFIPRDLKDELKKLKLELKDDGNLLNEEGEKIVLIVKSDVFELDPDEENDNQDRRELAYPYHWSQYSWSLYYRVDWGFCRSLKAYATAEAWGPLRWYV